MTTPRSTAFGFGMAGMLLGGLFIWLATGSERDEELAAIALGAARLNDTAAQFGDRTEQLGVLLGDLERSLHVRSNVAVPEPLVPSVLPDLMSRLDALDATLSELAAVVERMSVMAANPTSSLPQLELADRPVATAELEEVLRADDISRDLKHFGWSYQQVLDAYGQPSTNWPSPNGNGQKWVYELPSGKELTFWFIDNRIMKIFD